MCGGGDDASKVSVGTNADARVGLLEGQASDVSATSPWSKPSSALVLVFLALIR
jgi:hypothetical protein